MSSFPNGAPLIVRTKAPSYATLRPVKGTGASFPIYKTLVADLVAARPRAYDSTAAYVCAVAAAWAYSEAVTLSSMMARLGLEENTCRFMGIANDAMFIASSAFLIQSRCGKVLILCYRGTEPRNFINWMTDANVSPQAVQFKFHGKDTLAEVHGGFYRNVRATWYDVVAGLTKASQGQSVTDGPDKVAPFEALYICGHSLGAAMAAIAAVKLATDPAYAGLAERLRGIYTFGQPMVGKPQFAAECERVPVLRDGVFRHVFEHDLVPRLPPKVCGDFSNFGAEYRSEQKKGATLVNGSPLYHWIRSESPVQQVLEPVLSNLVGVGAFLAQQFPALARLPLSYSWDHHSPNYYLQCTQPAEVRSEFEM